MERYIFQTTRRYSKQPEDIRADPTRKLWTSRYKIHRTTKNTWVDQEELLVAENKKWYQEIYSGMPEMLAK